MKELIIILGLFSAIVLFFVVIAFIYLQYKDRINERDDLKIHIVIGTANLFLGITIFMTDFQNGLDVFLENLYAHNSPMPLQYLFWAILNFALAYHLIKHHYKKD